jgi:hypothetical protein
MICFSSNKKYIFFSLLSAFKIFGISTTLDECNAGGGGGYASATNKKLCLNKVQTKKSTNLLVSKRANPLDPNEWI